MHQPSDANRSRRQLLAGALTGAAAWVAGSLARPSPAHAEGEAIVVGGEYATAQSATVLQNGANPSTVFRGQSLGNGVGIHGVSATGIGVLGGSGTADVAGSAGVSGVGSGARIGVQGISGSGNGVQGTSNSGIGAFGESLGSVGVKGKAWGGGETSGVLGESQSQDGAGVRGTGLNNGTGVVGTGRVGVFATSSTAGWMAIWGRHFGGGYGIAGDSLKGIGASGTSDAIDKPGVLARSRGYNTGILGFSGGTGDNPPATPAEVGVYGHSAATSISRGVLGKSTTGQGVRGEVTSGVGVSGNASSAAGYAFRGSGRVRFDKVSGVASIPAGATSVTITPGVDITADSFVLLTPKANIGTRSLYFTTDATANTFRIRMSSSRTSSTSVAWLLLR